MITKNVTRRAAMGKLAGAAAAPIIVTTHSASGQALQIIRAAGDGVADDSVALQRAIDAASSAAVSGVSGRSLVRLAPGRQYRIETGIYLDRVTIDARGASFLLASEGGFLVGADCGILSASTQLICEKGWSGTVFRRDPDITPTAHINMTGRLVVTRLGDPDTTNGTAVDMTGFHRSRVDIEVRGLKYGIYAMPARASDQTYFNRISLRCQNVATAIHLETKSHDILNGNVFDYVSATSVRRGIRLLTSGPAAGPSSNTFHIAHIEQFARSGIAVSGSASNNMFIGGILESGRANDVPCIDVERGAFCNTFITSVAPGASSDKAFRSADAKNNTFFLGAYGTYIGWSTDTGVGLTVAPNNNAEVHFGQPVYSSSEGAPIEHDSNLPLIPLATGGRVFNLKGEGTVTGIDRTGLPANPSTGSALGGTVEITIIGNDKATLANSSSGVKNSFRLKGAADVTIPRGEMITFLFTPSLSSLVREKSRSF